MFPENNTHLTKGQSSDAYHSNTMVKLAKWILISLWSLLVLTASAELANVECKFADLTGATFQKCFSPTDNDVLPLTKILWETLPQYTICQYECSNSKSVSRMCENGIWTGPKCKEHRIKRAFWRRRRRRPPPPPPDRTPPVLNCPGNIYLSAGKMTTGAVARWSEPRAYDAKNGYVSTPRSGMPPGSWFREGWTYISYSARDYSGNRASCRFGIRVSVTRCRAPAYSVGRVSCSGGKTYLYGSVCKFQCTLTGYELLGSTSTECLSSGKWNQAIPSCQRVVCGDPGSLTHGNAKTTGTRYGDVVSYTCDTNYNITGDVSRTCQANRTWNGSLPTCWYATSCSSSPCLNEATCTNTLGSYKCTCKPGWTGQNCERDIQPPVMDGCPSSIALKTSQPEEEVSWLTPKFNDPMGNPLQISSNYQTNTSSFPWGDYTVHYTALKQSNGERTECKFNISVKPYPCEPLEPPTNAVLLCNGWNTDILNLCVLVCKSGYSVPRGFSEDVVYVCGSSGEWSPRGALPQCLGRGTNSARTSSPTDCSHQSTRKELSLHFIHVIKKSRFYHICLKYPCDANNVNIVC